MTKRLLLCRHSFLERKRDEKGEGGEKGEEEKGWHDYRDGSFFPLERKLEEKRRNQRVLAQMDNNERQSRPPIEGLP